MFGNLGQLADLMRNSGKLRESFEKATEALAQVEVEGTAGGGAVVARVNGRMEVVAVRIDPKLVADGDTELLEDLVTAAVNQGLNKAREAAAQSAAQSFATFTGGLPVAGLSNLFGPGAGGGPGPGSGPGAGPSGGA